MKVIRDDIVDADATVSSGNVTAGGTPTTYLEAGLNFDVEVKTNPVELRLPSGSVASQQKRIVEVTPNLFLTQNLTINGTRLPCNKQAQVAAVVFLILQARKK